MKSIKARHRKSSVLVASIAALATMASYAGSVCAATLHRIADHAPGRYIVVLDDTVDDRTRLTARAEADAVTQRVARMPGAKIRARFNDTIIGMAVDLDRTALRQLQQDPAVKYVQQDGRVTLKIFQDIHALAQDRVDDRYLPQDESFIYDTYANNVNAYIVDSGINPDHIEFRGRVRPGFTSIADGRGIRDCNGHGTHVAGLVGGTWYGMAKGVSIYPVRVFGCTNTSYWSDVIAGLEWVKRNHIKPAVVNMSFGGSANPAVDAAVQALIDDGITVVAAAGNENADACQTSPARVPDVITVTASGSNGGFNVPYTADVRSSFSNYGPCVDLFAPGEYVSSASNIAPESINIAQQLDGTSGSAALTSGVAATYLSGRPTATPLEVASAIRGAATRDIIVDAKGTANLHLYSRVCGAMYAGQTLRAGRSLVSCDGGTALHLGFDGLLSIIRTAGGTTRVAGPFGRDVRLLMQANGNLVLLDSLNRVKWTTNTSANPAAFLRMQDDGNLVLYKEDNSKALWSSRYGRTTP